MAKGKNIVSLLLIFFFLLTAACGCREQGVEPHREDGTAIVDYTYFRVGLMEDIAFLDPIGVTTYGELTVARTLYETLFIIEPDTERLIPLLVEHWEVSPDRQIYTFRLRKDIKFHSGRDLTAEDVKFSWQRVVAYGSPDDLAGKFMLIGGARDYAEGRTNQIAGIQVIDPHTLQVSLTQPSGQFLWALAHPGAAIVDMQVVQLVGDQYGKPGTYQSPAVVLAGTGPFSIVEWIGGYQVTLQAFEQYHGETAQIDRLEFSQYLDLDALLMDFQAEYLDLVIAPGLVEEAQVAEDRVLSLPGTEFYYLGMNPKIKPFDDPQVRKAVGFSLDRVFLAEHNRGVPWEGLLPPSLLGNSSLPAGYRYDSPEVRDLLQNEEGEKVLEEPLTLTVPEGEEWASLAGQVQSQLENAGFHVNLEILPSAQYQQAVKNGQAGFFLTKWQYKLPAPEFFLESRFASWGTANWSGFAHPVVDDRLLFIQNIAESERERLAGLLEIEELVQEEAVMITLFAVKRCILVQENVQGLELLPLGLVAWEKCFR